MNLLFIAYGVSGSSKPKTKRNLKTYLNGDLNGLSKEDAKTCSTIAATYEVDEDGRLFYCPKTLTRDEDRDDVVRLVVPESLQQEFLHHYHTSLEGGHQGVGRTYRRIRTRFHWRNLYRSVQRYVGECTDCETGKGKPTDQGRSPGNVQGTYPFQVISMDHIPSLPKSFKGNTELLIWADLFTGYIRCCFLVNEWVGGRQNDSTNESQHEYYFDKIGQTATIATDQGHGRELEVQSIKKGKMSTSIRVAAKITLG
ncbi:LOW QUALITY PROTEIN: reverse transcriptase [Phytophthora megakarya]|uniref:Reverse transcriptase n=1 Tax=Phytophthora megakarya TaxID=4795 RepID=A0A225VDB1_9STRA|nr:LOW QUALITY PROTEIN: reverse transcriptase [Phytophthora megakarya]